MGPAPRLKSLDLGGQWESRHPHRRQCAGVDDHFQKRAQDTVEERRWRRFWRCGAFGSGALTGTADASHGGNQELIAKAGKPDARCGSQCGGSQDSVAAGEIVTAAEKNLRRAATAEGWCSLPHFPNANYVGKPWYRGLTIGIRSGGND